MWGDVVQMITPVRRLVEDELQEIRDEISKTLCRILPGKLTSNFHLGASYAFSLYMKHLVKEFTATKECVG